MVAFSHQPYVAFAAGGLGDLVKAYFGFPEWRTVEVLKEICPDAITMAYVRTHGYFPATGRELFCFNPLFDYFIFDPHPIRLRRDLLALRIVHGKDWEWEYDAQPKLYVTPQEYLTLTQFWAVRNRLIILSPYSGDDNKSYKDILGMPQFCELAYALVDLNHVVAILGQTRWMESMPLPNLYESPRIFDLRNAASFRVSIGLARMAAGYIGMSTCLLAAAWSANAPNVFFWPEERKENGIADILAGRRPIPPLPGEWHRVTGIWKADKPFTKAVVRSADSWKTVTTQFILDNLKAAQCSQTGPRPCRNGPISAWIQQVK